MHRVAACLTVGLLLFGCAASAAAQEPPPPPEESFEGEISVSLVTMVVRVVDSWGQPILGLKPENLRVRVGRQEIPVVALDWISAGDDETVVLERARPADEDAEVALPPDRLAEPNRGPGRLVVIFVQADLNTTRISGQLRLRPYTRDLLATLRPDDRIAVVSFDSHLKLWQDFTPDAEATHEAIDRAMLYSPEWEVLPSGAISLARHFDFAAARKAASPERALELTARALEPLPGEKTMIFLGWGLGRFGSTGVRMTPDYGPAVRALSAARASVFVLDVTSADYHSLEVGLQGVAEATGGVYFSTFRLPGLATKTLARTISGYYVLTLDRSSLAEEEGKVRIDLRGKNGTVLARPTAVR
jgi:VWFA-related protein